MSEVVVRPMTLADVEQFNHVSDVVFRERQYMAFVEGFPLDECATFVARNLRLGNPQFVAEDAGRVVGWVDIQRETRPVHAHVGHLGIGVLPEYRGRRIGEKLMRAALDAARAGGFEKIELHVYGRNTRAAALYRKLGFAHEGTRVKAKKVDGEYDDVHIMGLLL